MSQIRLYFDEDAGKLSLVQALRNSGQDVMTTSEVMLERYEIAKETYFSSRFGRLASRRLKN